MSSSFSTEKNNTNNNYDTTVEQDGKQINEPSEEQSSSCLSTPPKPILKSTEKCQKPVCTPEFPNFKSKVCRELSYKSTD